METGDTCFWDNPQGVLFPRYSAPPLTSFIGGEALEANNQGTCSDCHAGENPFVVHPYKPSVAPPHNPPFMALGETTPKVWPEPIVHPAWPQNPGPIDILQNVPSTERCDTCHVASIAGRYPALRELPNYCAVVLMGSLLSPPTGTMPPTGNQADYWPHIQRLIDECDLSWVLPTVGASSFTDDTTKVSEPIILGPLYACTTSVTVQGAVLDATLTVEVNNVVVATTTARDPDEVTVTVPVLQVGDIVDVAQTVGAATSDEASMTVRDHQSDYPTGLPAPEIDPTTVYECADRVAARHVPGAKVTTRYNGATRQGTGTSSGYSVFTPMNGPFVAGGTLDARQQICNTVSAYGNVVTVQPPPKSPPSPTFHPAHLYEGQELVNLRAIEYGATIEVRGFGGGILRNTVGSWPTFRKNGVDLLGNVNFPLIQGETLEARPDLCEPWAPRESAPALGCADLPPPRARSREVGRRSRVSDMAGSKISLREGVARRSPV